MKSQKNLLPLLLAVVLIIANSILVTSVFANEGSETDLIVESEKEIFENGGTYKLFEGEKILIHAQSNVEYIEYTILEDENTLEEIVKVENTEAEIIIPYDFTSFKLKVKLPEMDTWNIYDIKIIKTGIYMVLDGKIREIKPDNYIDLEDIDNYQERFRLTNDFYQNVGDPEFEFEAGSIYYINYIDYLKKDNEMEAVKKLTELSINDGKVLLEESEPFTFGGLVSDIQDDDMIIKYIEGEVDDNSGYIGNSNIKVSDSTIIYAVVPRFDSNCKLNGKYWLKEAEGKEDLSGITNFEVIIDLDDVNNNDITAKYIIGICNIELTEKISILLRETLIQSNIDRDKLGIYTNRNGESMVVYDRKKVTKGEAIWFLHNDISIEVGGRIINCRIYPLLGDCNNDMILDEEDVYGIREINAGISNIADKEKIMLDFDSNGTINSSDITTLRSLIYLAISIEENYFYNISKNIMDKKVRDYYGIVEETIQFQDENLYNEIVRLLEDIIVSKDDDELSIIIEKEDIDEVNILELANKKISNISGIEKFTSLTKLNLKNNNLEDISALENIWDNLSDKDISNQNIKIELEEGTEEVDAPQILRSILNDGRIILNNCRLNDDATKIILINKNKGAVITIKGGNLEGTKIKIGETKTSSGGGGGKVEKPEEPVIDPDPPEWINPFKDVSEDDWYYETVKYVSENEILKGIKEDEFGVNVAITRGMIVEVIYRLSGEKTDDNATYDDVYNYMYYSKAIAWASQNGIVIGVGNNKFEPDREAKREEIVLMLHRYAKYMNRNVTADKREILKYDDYNVISDYALNTFEWAVERGIIIGMDEKTLAPKNMATRIQIALMIERFCKLK